MPNSSKRSARRGRKKTKQRILRWLVILSLLCAACFFLYRERRNSASSYPALPADAVPGISVTFLDVGQGDSTLIVCDGEAMLIDGGTPEHSSLLYSVLRREGIRSLRCVAATHPHIDHAGGLPGALQAARAQDALCCTTEYPSSAFSAFKRALEEQNTTLRVPAPGETFLLGSAAVTVLGPLEENEEMNNNSLVFRIRYGEISFLITGDCQAEEELSLLAAEKAGFLPGESTNGNGALRSTVLKVGHHGSSDASSREFLEAVSPAYAVISCGSGEENPYGHPHARTLEKLEERNVKIYRTDKDKDIRFLSNGHALTVLTGDAAAGKPDPDHIAD